MEFYRYNLPNGIRCIHKRVRSGVAHCALSINTGSRDELEGEFGLAHFVEHCMFRGTETRSSYEILNLLESNGGELNAYTGKEETVVHATTLTRDIELAVDIIADVVFNSTFEPQKITPEREVIVDEINGNQDSLPDAIYDNFEDLIFKNSSLGHSILGLKKGVRSFTKEDIELFRKRTYTTDSMVFSLIGDLSREEFVGLCDRYLGWVEASERGFERNDVKGYKSFSRSEEKSESQIHYMLGNRSYGMRDRRRLPATIMTNLLGGQNINSLLNVALREDNGLTYNVEANINSFEDSGIFSIYLTTDKRKLDKCIGLVASELDKLRDVDKVAVLLPSAQKQFLGQFMISTESRENYMLAAARSYLLYNKIDSLRMVEKKIMGVTAEEVTAVANQMFDDMSTLIYR